MPAKRDDKTVKIERDLGSKINIIVEAFGLDGQDVSIGRYISDALRPIVARDFDKAMRIMEKHKKDGK